MTADERILELLPHMRDLVHQHGSTVVRTASRMAVDLEYARRWERTEDDLNLAGDSASEEPQPPQP